VRLPTALCSRHSRAAAALSCGIPYVAPHRSRARDAAPSVEHTHTLHQCVHTYTRRAQLARGAAAKQQRTTRITLAMVHRSIISLVAPKNARKHALCSSPLAPPGAATSHQRVPTSLKPSPSTRASPLSSPGTHRSFFTSYGALPPAETGCLKMPCRAVGAEAAMEVKQRLRSSGRNFSHFSTSSWYLASMEGDAATSLGSARL